jgi:hypothetical protein
MLRRNSLIPVNSDRFHRKAFKWENLNFLGDNVFSSVLHYIEIVIADDSIQGKCYEESYSGIVFFSQYSVRQRSRDNHFVRKTDDLPEI